MQKTFILLVTLLALTACETVKGAGRDLGKVGNAVSNSAEKVQNSL